MPCGGRWKVHKTILKKTALSFALFFLSLTAPSSLYAAAFPVSGDEGASYWPIERLDDKSGAVVPTQHLAVIKTFSDASIRDDVWIPSELLKQMNLPIKLNEGRTAFTLRVTNPAQVFGIPALSGLAGGALDLDFRARSDDNVQRLNLRDTERIAGLSCTLTDRQTVLVGNPGKMPPADFPARAVLPALKKPFNLVWDHVSSENKDLTAETPLPGLCVISPTWFALTHESGTSLNKGSAGYVEAAHKKGYHVWALVSNSFNKARTRKFLASGKAQDLFIARLLAYARIYGFDGINVDFESMDNADAARLTAFVRKLTGAARTMGLSMSIDVMIPTAWSKCYDRAALAQIVDYVAVMTYDEHWRTSPKAGSTASLPWVKRGLLNTLALVPSDKLLLGIPFYTREWEESRAANGKISVRSKAMAMASADLRLQETGASKTWLGNVGQHYFQYTSGDKTFKVWIEDENSIGLRMDLVKLHNLAGAAFWRKGFEKTEVWDVIEKAGAKETDKRTAQM